MSSRLTWSRRAQIAVSSALDEGRGLGLEGKALEKFVSDAYPFGSRECYPYKIWLAWFARLVKGKRGPLEPRRHKKD